MPSYQPGRGRPFKLTDEEIADLYASGMDSDSVGARAGCSPGVVLQLVRAAGGTVRKPGSHLRPLLISEEEIVRRYHDGDSGPLLAGLAGCSSASIYVILRRHGASVRDRNPAAATARAKLARARRAAHADE